MSSPVPEDNERASRRYLRLVEELSHEREGRKYGWISRVARELGMTQGYISKLVNKVRDSVGPEAIDKAVARLRLKRDYFYTRDEPASYHDFLRGHEPVYKAWREFVESPWAQNMTPAERDALCDMSFPDGTEPTKAFYDGMLLLLRNSLNRQEFEASLAENEQLDRELEANRRRKVNPDDDGKNGPR